MDAIHNHNERDLKANRDARKVHYVVVVHVVQYRLKTCLTSYTIYSYP